MDSPAVREAGGLSSEAQIPDRSPGEVEEGQPLRTVAFPDYDVNANDEKHLGVPRPRGVEMRREMTKEDKELAAAGYEHLDVDKTKGKGGSKKSEFENVDIREHGLSLSGLAEELDTSFDIKNASASAGLTNEEAQARLARDGKNILTPPKKKSALRKVKPLLCQCVCVTLNKTIIVL